MVEHLSFADNVEEPFSGFFHVVSLRAKFEDLKRDSEFLKGVIKAFGRVDFLWFFL